MIKSRTLFLFFSPRVTFSFRIFYCKNWGQHFLPFSILFYHSKSKTRLLCCTPIIVKSGPRTFGVAMGPIAFWPPRLLGAVGMGLCSACEAPTAHPFTLTGNSPIRRLVCLNNIEFVKSGSINVVVSFHDKYHSNFQCSVKKLDLYELFGRILQFFHNFFFFCWEIILGYDSICSIEILTYLIPSIMKKDAVIRYVKRQADRLYLDSLN